MALGSETLTQRQLGLEGLRQTVASTYKTTRVGGGGGGILHRQILSFTIHDLGGFVQPIIQTSEKSKGHIAPSRPGEQCMVKISLLLITTLTHVMIQMKATNQRGK